MSLFKSSEKKAKMMKDEINILLERNNARLINFEFYYNVFGNIIVEIEVNNQIHLFMTDRGEIYHNQKIICDNSYHVAGKSDTFEMLVDVIKRELF